MQYKWAVLAQRALPVLPQPQASGEVTSSLATGRGGGAGESGGVSPRPPSQPCPFVPPQLSPQVPGIKPERGGGSFASGCCSFKQWGGRVGRGVGAPMRPESDPINHQRQHSGMSGGIPEPSALCPMNPMGPGAGIRACRVEAGITPRSLGGGGPWLQRPPAPTS